MQVQCPNCPVIATLGTTKWFFDGGECRELKGIELDQALEKCPFLSEAVSKAKKNFTQRP